MNTLTERKFYFIVLIVTVVLIFGTGLRAKAVPSAETVQKELTALKISHPPKLDGVLDDACWQDAPQAINFIDERTGKPAENQSVAMLVYTDKAIYVACHLYDDSPGEILAKETKDGIRLQGEDWVSFSIDPFHTHRFGGRNFFMANSLGTKYAHLTTGIEGQTKWLQSWHVAAQIVDDGWVVEMEIPWRVLDYPETAEPIQMGINFDRGQQRTGVRSWWANVGRQEFYENDGHWVGVSPSSQPGRIFFNLPELPEAKVEVNLSGKLIGLFTKSAAKTQPKFAELIDMLDGIYVRTYNTTSIDAQKVVNHYKSKLKREKWDVLVKLNDEGETVQVSLLFDAARVRGIFAIVVSETSEEVTFVNIVGNIDSERIGELLGNLDDLSNLDIDINLNQSKEESSTERND